MKFEVYCSVILLCESDHRTKTHKEMTQPAPRAGHPKLKTLITDSTWMINILFVKQISDNLRSVPDQNHLVGYMRLTITEPSVI